MENSSPSLADQKPERSATSKANLINERFQIH